MITHFREWLAALSRDTIDAAVATTGSKVTFTGAGTSALSALFSSQAGVLYGVVIGIAGILVNWHFKRRAEKREQEARQRDQEARQRQEHREQLEHEARMRQLESNPEGVHRATL